ncbi:hypothetical protein NJT12_24345 [Flavobacterium sp. AC]|uniref:DUF3592 domain-containing protein n=1 Tax=Flavobacterium azizsancarii TaxID=2961580 RepID=A0ABT4WJI6_9FLAO|nr:hypothetical protein [Flavobacterium azizsancarii]MDA6072758.1 hypothetical protein [Flavobacterium azizsancarii]
MENQKKIIREITIRLSLVVVTLVIFFFLITLTIDVISDFSIYNNRNNYTSGKMKVTRIGADSYGSPHLYANGYVENIKTSVYLGLENEVKIKDYYPILYKPDGKQSFLTTKDFKFTPINYLYSGIFKILGILFLLFLVSRIYKYFKNSKLEF